MILNHKDAIVFLVDNAEGIGFNPFTIRNLHGFLANNLLPEPQAAGRLRQIEVEIGQSVFRPLAMPQLIEECFNQILDTARAISDPFEQSFFIMVHLPYLQPFEDVNKVEGATPRSPRNTITKAWGRVRKRVNMEDAHIYDLRRTVGSWHAQEGFSLHILGGVINQSTAHTTEVYARLNDAPIKSAFDHQSATIRAVLRLGDAEPVIPPSLLQVREESTFLDCREIYQAVKILSLTARQLEVLMIPERIQRDGNSGGIGRSKVCS